MAVVAGVAVAEMPMPVREYRFVVDLGVVDLPAFREALAALAGGFTEIATDRGTRYVVGMRGRGAKERLLKLLAIWASRTRAGRIEIEDRSTVPDRDEIYFLLPLKRNPEPDGGPRPPLFTNEQLTTLRTELARRFHFRPEMARVYGEWRNDVADLVVQTNF